MKNLVNKELIKSGLKTVGGIVKTGCDLAVPFIVYSLFNGGGKRIIDKIEENKIVKYDDVIKAIIDSDMMSSYQKDAMALVKRNEDPAYYKTIVHIVKSNAMSSNKIDMIKVLNGENQGE